METALQQLQNWINGEAAKRHALASWKTFTAIELLDKIQSLIPTEKNQIEDAYRSGHSNTVAHEMEFVYRYELTETFADYYTQTYQSK